MPRATAEKNSTAENNSKRIGAGACPVVPNGAIKGTEKDSEKH